MKTLLLLSLLTAALAATDALLGLTGAFSMLAVAATVGIMIADYRRAAKPLNLSPVARFPADPAVPAPGARKLAA